MIANKITLIIVIIISIGIISCKKDDPEVEFSDNFVGLYTDTTNGRNNSIIITKLSKEQINIFNLGNGGENINATVNKTTFTIPFQSQGSVYVQGHGTVTGNELTIVYGIGNYAKTIWLSLTQKGLKQ